MNRIKSGADIFFGNPGNWIKPGNRVAIVVNQTTVLSDYTFWPEILEERAGVKLVRAFSPEHGLWAAEQDQVSCDDEKSSEIGVPVTSLYGGTPDTLRPSEGSLGNIDAVIYDIQDIGSRYYTYIYTMAYVMQAAAEAGARFIVLDRPNPLGGETVEGPILEKGYESFVGMVAGLAVRHGMTSGELARYFHSHCGFGSEPEIIRCKGLDRGESAFDYNFPWVYPSPNMPTRDTAFVYPGMCLLEGTNISEGRGTTLPFEVFGAPFLDSFQLCETLNSYELPGAAFRPQKFIPTFHKFAGQTCAGAQVHITDRTVFKPFETGLAVIHTLKSLAPEYFGWRQKPYEFITDKPAIDLLYGSNRFRLAIDNGFQVKNILQDQATASEFFDKRQSCLLY